MSNNSEANKLIKLRERLDRLITLIKSSPPNKTNKDIENQKAIVKEHIKICNL